jgi:hypothetical protein
VKPHPLAKNPPVITDNQSTIDVQLLQRLCGQHGLPLLPWTEGWRNILGPNLSRETPVSIREEEEFYAIVFYLT